MPNPSLPAWIVEISPHGQVDSLAQLRVRFADDVVPLQAIESKDVQAKLALFHVTPGVHGVFRFVTPRMVTFEANGALPNAMRIRITVAAGLTDLNGHRLAHDLVWTVETAPIDVGLPPSSDDFPWELKQAIDISVNAAVVPDSMRAHVRLYDGATNRQIPMTMRLQPDQQWCFSAPQRAFNPSMGSYDYLFSPQVLLLKDHQYRLEVTPGLQPVFGNLPSTGTYIETYRTYAPLAFKGIEKAHGQSLDTRATARFAGGTAVLVFNNPLARGSAVGNIAISPASASIYDLLGIPPDSDQYGGTYFPGSGPRLEIDPWHLAPDQRYVVRIDRGLTDKWGQHLPHTVRASFDTDDIAADFALLDGERVYPSTLGLKLLADVVSLPDDRYQAAFAPIDPLTLVYPDFPHEGMLPEWAVWQSFRNPLRSLPPLDRWNDFTIHGTRNTPTLIDLGLRRRLASGYGVLEYGMTADIPGTLNNPPDSRYLAFGRINVTDLGLFAQIMPREAVAFVHRLDTGAPVSGARVDFYVRTTGEPGLRAPQPCASGSTDADGALYLDAKRVSACRPWHELENERVGWVDMLVVARSGDDWTYVRPGGMGWYPTSLQWADTDLKPQGAFFSDRGLYQPGEKASFEAFAFYLSGDVLHRDAGARYQLSLLYPDGSTKPLGQQTTNRYGSFSYETTLPRNAQVGSYELSAKRADGLTFECTFRVAEFKAPNFAVSVKLDREIAVAGDEVMATGESKYLFGLPVDRGHVHVYVSRAPQSFTPHGWEEFRFERQFWPDSPPEITPVVLDKNTETDAKGAVGVAIPIEQSLPVPASYTVELTTKDASNLAVAASTTFAALPSRRLIGLSAPWVSQAGAPFMARAIVVDPGGKPIPGEALVGTLSRFVYDDAKQRWSSIDVGSAAATSATAPTSMTFTASQPGWYRVRMNFTHAPSASTESDQDVWIYGAGAVDWGQGVDHESVPIQLDKTAYEPGETATALLRSPYAQADLYFSVIRQHTLFRTMRHVTGGAPAVSFVVTPEMLPSATVEAVLVRRGAPIESAKGGVESLVRLGSATLTVKTDRRALRVSVTPVRATLRPGDRQTLEMRITGLNGAGVRGQITVIVADESILQLTGYRPPDLMQDVYGDWPSLAESADNRVNIALSQPTPGPIDREGTNGNFTATTADEYTVNGAALPAPMGYGVLGRVTTKALGVMSAQTVRENFLQLAYFNGSVETDRDGRASVSFKTPDNLTTWRVMAVAEGDGGDPSIDGPAGYRFGDGGGTFVTTLPLAANPLLPQFARPGDVFRAGVAVDNSTGRNGTLDVDGDVTGPLAFFLGTNPTQTIRESVAAVAGSQAFRFPLRAGPSGIAAVTFHVQLGSIGDAFRVPLEIKPLDFTESVVETGTTTSNAVIPLNVDRGVDDDAGGLDISMASSLLPEVLTPAKSIFEFDYLPLAEPLSSRVLAAADMQTLASRYHQSIAGLDPAAEAADALDQLYALQRNEGGFAWWPGSGLSDPYMSAYAGEALGAAVNARLPVEPSVVLALKSYLAARIEDPDPFHWCYTVACVERMRLEALQGLAALGDARDTHMDWIYAQANDFDLVSRIELARYMTGFSQWKPKAAVMTVKLSELFYETGRYATLNVPDDLWWFDSVTKGQAEAVRLLVAQRYDPAIVDRAVRGLLALRRKGAWENTYADAMAMTALVQYAGLEKRPPHFVATATLAGKTVANFGFVGYRPAEHGKSVSMADLPRGRSDLTLAKRGTGTLHYVVNYSYRLHGDQPGDEAGLLVTRDVRPAGSDELVASMGLARPSHAFALAVGRVYDVGLTITVDHPVNQVVIVDPLPSGCEAVDTTFDTTPRSQAAKQGSWEIDFQTIYRDRVVAFANYLPPGIYSMHYLVRTVTPGTFEWPGSQAFLEYAPEEFGRSASARAEVTP